MSKILFRGFEDPELFFEDDTVCIAPEMSRFGRDLSTISSVLEQAYSEQIPVVSPEQV